jgi:hypothetical protein
VKFSDALDHLPTDRAVQRVFGEPYQTPDGATVIPVAKIRGDRPAPLGVFVVRGGEASWVAAIDWNRIALIRSDHRSPGGRDRQPGGAPAAALAQDHAHGL